MSLAVPSKGPFETDRMYATRLEAFKAEWARQGIFVVEDQETEAGRAARSAIETVTRFIPTKNRNLPLFEAVKRRKRQKYPRNTR